MKSRIIILVIMASCLTACEDIFGDDLSGYSVRLISPSDSLIVRDTVIQLSWNQVETTADYQLQVAHPRFDSLVGMVKDTITSNTNKILTGLERGKMYQWRVRAIASSYVSPYSKPWMFIIEK